MKTTRNEGRARRVAVRNFRAMYGARCPRHLGRFAEFCCRNPFNEAVRAIARAEWAS